MGSELCIRDSVRADTAGSDEMISKDKDNKKAAIASSLSAKTYGLEIIKKNIENEKGNLTRFLVMGKNISQPDFEDKKYITSFLFNNLSSFILAKFLNLKKKL